VRGQLGNWLFYLDIDFLVFFGPVFPRSGYRVLYVPCPHFLVVTVSGSWSFRIGFPSWSLGNSRQQKNMIIKDLTLLFFA
jgi:hypothetical protein